MPDFTYMGTKKELAGSIASIAASLNNGPFLDLFSGISAAGTKLDRSRHVWCNDVQAFSRLLTEALYLSRDNRRSVPDAVASILKYGNINLARLCAALRCHVDQELSVLFGSDALAQVALQSELVNCLASNRDELLADFSHCMFTASYAGTYVGLTQAMQLDSIRYGSDEALSRNLISEEEHRWAVLASCRALSALSNSTGHFAQYLTASKSNISRVVGKRRRCAWDYWLSAFQQMSPLGSVRWRRGNRVFHGDANEILEELRVSNAQPSIVYADPPYTSDQYSRFYHLLDTTVLYDYPDSVGKGQYRSDRFTSGFSLKSQVVAEFEKLISRSAKVSSAVVISYPSNGLLDNSLDEIPRMLRQHFRYVRKPKIIPHQHSTMGGSKGKQREKVEECIFVGRA